MGTRFRRILGVVKFPGGEGKEGPAGPVGPAGPAGPAGPEGPKGATGLEGKAGPAGPEGKEGKEGKEGPAGSGGGALVWHALPGMEAFGEPYSPPEYAVGGDGILHFRGLSKEITAPGGTTLGTLPEAAWPSHKRLMWVGNGNNPAFGELIAVNTDGTVKTTMEMVSFIVVLDDKSVPR